MVKSEMGLDMDLSFFDEPAPPTGSDGAASKTLTEKQPQRGPGLRRTSA